MQELTKLLAELAVDDDDIGLHWNVKLTSENTIVSAATRDLFRDEVAALEGARNLWTAILDLGRELTEEGEDQIGAIRRPGQGWRGRVFMVLAPM